MKNRHQIDPPPLYFLIVIKIYNIWYVFWKPLYSTLANLQKSKYLYQNLFLKQKMCKEKWLKLQQIIHFWKTLDPANSSVQKHLQNFFNLNVYSSKTENVQIPL